MKVAIISGPYLPIPPIRYGGTEQVIFNLIKGLKELGHEPILFGTGDSEVDCEVVEIAPKSLTFPKTVSEWRGIEIEGNKIMKNAKKLLRSMLGGIDIIHSHGVDLTDFQDFPNITTLHGRIDFEEFDYFQKRKNLYYASISKNQQKTFKGLKYAGVAYNGLDYMLFPVVLEPEDYLCFLGRFDGEKNPHLAIKLAIKLGMKIKLGGKIDFQGSEYFDKEVKPFLNHPLVEFLGELNFQEKVELISNAKCNLHPISFREPFGLSVLESAYCGTPTLAIARGSMSELIEEGRTGILVEDFVEGFHKIEACFEMDRMYIAQRSRFLFNHQSMTKQYLRAYENVIGDFKNVGKNLEQLEEAEKLWEKT